MKTLAALLRNPVASVRFEAAAACGRLGAHAKSSLPALKVATEDGSLIVRQAA